MIPNVFVSSTVQDLQYLRDAIRDQILEIGYNPIMSDYGEIGYLPSASAESSCYLSMKECQLAVLIIGKKCSSLAKDGLSVTHNEYVVAKENSIPVVCLIDKDVIAYKRVYDHKRDKGESEVGSFPEMDNPELTFKFINDFKDSQVNNGFLPFSNASDAMRHLKMQLAHIFGQLLRDRFDPIKGSIKDILSEIKTLKFELLKDEAKNYDYEPFLRSIRFLLDDQNSLLRSLMIYLFDSLEEGVVNVIKYPNFSEFFQASGYEMVIVDVKDLIHQKGHGFSYDAAFTAKNAVNSETNETVAVTFGLDREGKKIITNETTAKIFSDIFEKLKLLQIGSKKFR